MEYNGKDMCQYNLKIKHSYSSVIDTTEDIKAEYRNVFKATSV
jgi:hypothetical protein